jgi:sugar phosphate isomerase/epimerase
MAHLSKLCRDLGGTTLIYGGGRQRRELSLDDAFAESEAFFQDLLPRIEGHGTIFCFEPLGPKDSDFINSVYDSIRLVKALDHPALKVQLDAKALVAVDELTGSVFKDAAPYLVHVHANEPDLGVLGSSGDVDHATIGAHLNAIDYGGYVSIEQKMIDGEDPLKALAQSARVLGAAYR